MSQETQEKYEKEIITVILETDRGFNVYTGIGAKYVDIIGIAGLQKREPDLFTPDMYKAVTFAVEYGQSKINARIVFLLGVVAGVRREQQQKEPKEPLKPALAELCINLAEGQAVVSPEGTVEFCDTGMNISLQDLKFVVQEAEAYLTYRGERGAIQELKQHQKAKYLAYQGECGECGAQTETR